MKKTIFIIAMLCIAIKSSAQITDTGSNVGIGTSTPASKLHIQNSNATETYNTYLGGNSLHFNRSANGASYLDKTDSGDLILRFGLPVVNRFIFTNDGKLGIETTLPKSKLDLGGNYSNPGVYPNKITLWSGGENNYFGFGISSADLDYFSQYNHRFHTGYNGNPGSEKMVINAVGNVGIGTPSPSTRLEVYHSGLRTVQINPQNQLDVTGNSSLTIKEFVPSIEFHDSSSSSSDAVAFANHNKFFIGKKTGAKIMTSNLFNVDLNNGNVGIGTPLPNTKLEVHHSDLRTVQINPQNQLDVTGNSSLTIKEFVPSIEFHDSSTSSANAVAFANHNKFFIGKKTGAKIMTSNLFNVDLNNGNVGIGTSVPRSRLDIGRTVGANKGLKIGDYIEINERETINNAGVIGFNASIDAGNVRKFKPSWAGSSYASGMVMSMSGGGYGDLNFYGYNWGTDTTPRSLEEFTHVLHIGTNGEVGIGTTKTKGFKLGVDGRVAATEVKIAKYANWADFVFAKTYKLPTLIQVENHIKEKGHLKDIPSAAEVKKDGFFLGEMDAKLLQKIEELTLYTIQQEKELKKHKEEINQLKKQNTELLKLAKEIEKIKQKLK